MTPDRALSTMVMRFSEHVQEELDPDRRRHLASLAEQLGPWTQGPFDLGGGLVVGENCRSHERWNELKKHLPGDLSGKRVLAIDGGPGYDAFMFHMLGAGDVLSADPAHHRQAVFLESVYRTGVTLSPIGWQDLRREEHGAFDIVQCLGVVHRELHPMLLLGRIARLMAPDGTALIGTPLLPDEESEYLRFVQETHDGDPETWWLPGRRALRRMMRVAGLMPLEEFEAPADLPRLGRDRFWCFKAQRSEGGEDAFPVAAKAAPVAGETDRAVVRFAYPPGHFYSAEPDLRKLASEPTYSRVWPATPHPTPGIDWRGDAQLELCTAVLAGQKPITFPALATDDPTEYFAANSLFTPLDAWVLQGLLRELKPSRMIEVGSGYSSLVAARVNREFLGDRMQVTCIEPFPPPFLLNGVRGITSVRIEEVQETPLTLFEELEAGDVLFVDTSHTVKTGGEVPWIFGQVIPRLSPGVVVHIHDVFLPGDYPRQWALDEGRNWNENYLVEAFLAFNSVFEVLFGSQWMIQNHRDALLRAFPGLLDRSEVEEPVLAPMRPYVLGDDSGSSLWLRRVEAR